jgi:hypothetical protein
VLRVSLADYDIKEATAAAAAGAEQAGDAFLGVGAMLSTVSSEKKTTGPSSAVPSRNLPSECESDLYPVVLICNVYSSNDVLTGGDEFLAELEVRVIICDDKYAIMLLARAVSVTLTEITEIHNPP